MSCDCKVCRRHLQFAYHLTVVQGKGLNSTAQFLEQIYTELNHTELDRDVQRAIVEGKWPSSEEILAQHRKEEDG